MEEKNQVDGVIYNEKSLNLLNIRELRALGRKFGVPSPATKKKKELIDYILNVVYGKVEVPVRTSFGRPSTNEFDMDKYLDKIKRNYDYSNELKKITFRNDLGYGILSNASSTYKILDNIETRVFCEVNGKYYLRVRSFVESEDDIEISSAFVKKFNLVNYDAVEIIKSDKLFKIYSINGQKVKDKMGKIIVDGKELIWGEKQDFYLSTKEELNNSINSLILDAQKNHIKLVILSDKDYECNEGVSIIKYSESEDVHQLYKKIMMLVGLCEKYILDGEDLIVCISDADIIENTISKFDEDVAERISKHFKEMIKTIIDLGNIYIDFKIEIDLKY